MSTLLEVKDITKIYPNQPKPGLDHVSFEVMQGEFLGIMGASGSGKTTLLNVLSTIDIPTSGSIRMGGKKIQELSQTQAADFRKNNLGFIFQEYFLLDSLTVQENIAVPLTLLHESAKTIDKKVMELAELFGIASTATCSGGSCNGKTPAVNFCRRTHRGIGQQFSNGTALCPLRSQSGFRNNNFNGNT